jgi:hypothetical protein
MSLYEYVASAPTRFSDPSGATIPDGVDSDIPYGCSSHLKKLFEGPRSGALSPIREFLFKWSPIRGVWLGVGAAFKVFNALVFIDFNADTGVTGGVEVFLAFGETTWFGFGWMWKKDTPWYGKVEGVFWGTKHTLFGVGPEGGQAGGGTDFGRKVGGQKIGIGFVGVDIGIPPGLQPYIPYIDWPRLGQILNPWGPHYYDPLPVGP